MIKNQNSSRQIKQISLDLGFSYCGIAKCKQLDEDARKLENWLNQGYHGTMHYMANHFDLRINPGKLVPGAKTVLTLLMNYYPAAIQPAQAPKISKYAYGTDYHQVIREKLQVFLDRLRALFGNVQGRGFVDSAPVLERAWARETGLGWIGKNGNLITRQNGSFFFIATLITDLEADQYDDPYAKDYCGTCTKCIDACPTEAIEPDRVINGSKCISYFTIELKEELIPAAEKGRFENWLFGCDICQDVCPWNRFSTPSKEEQFTPIPELFHLKPADWEAMGEEKFRKLFRNSPLKRTKYKGIIRNLRFLELPG